MNETAPFFHDIAQGPATASAVWVKASDGVRLRVAIWPEVPDQPPKGTVLLFPGRTEFVEKYGLVAAEFAARGFAMVAVDWRCQGLADRLLPNRLTGDVRRFSDYQLDVAAMMQVVAGADLPEPLYLLGHSMGGTIGLQALRDGLPVKAAVFTAPMWGIEMAPHLRPLAWALSSASRYVGLSHLFTPGTRTQAYVTAEPFAGNVLTSDPDMYAYMQQQLAAHPELALGGPSLRWLYEALRDVYRLATSPSPAIPTLTFLGSAEDVIQPKPVHTRMREWPGGELHIVRGGRHEVMMETVAIRELVFDKIATHLAGYP